MEVRRQSINKYLSNEEDGLFYDYNFVTNTQSHYLSCTNLYSLWSGFATQHQADKILRNIRLFEQPGGLVSGTKDSLLTTPSQCILLSKDQIDNGIIHSDGHHIK